jgi:hypothetical protein
MTSQKKNVLLEFEDEKEVLVEVEEEEEEVEEEEEEEEEEVDEEKQILLEIEERRKKLEFVRQKKALKKNAGKYAEKIKDMLNHNIEFNKKSIEESYKTIQKLSQENDDYEEMLTDLNELKDEEDIMNYLADNFGEEVNEMINEETPKEKPMSKTPKKNIVKADNVTDLFKQLGGFDEPIYKDNLEVVVEEKPKGKRTAIDRKAYPNYLLDKMVFKASGFHKVEKNRGKISMEIVFNAKTKTFYNRGQNKKEYKFLQDANRVWCNERGYEKLGNAWEDFQAVNLKTNEVRSIQYLHLDNWIEKEGAEDYIDKSFKI